MRNILISLLLILISSCKSQEGIVSMTITNEENETSKYSGNYPSGDHKFEWYNNHGLMSVITYGDSSVYYLQDKNVEVDLNFIRKEASDPKFTSRELFSNDTLHYSGLYKKKYWKEVIFPEIIVGYYNVTEERLAEFDSAIFTLIREEK